MITKDERDNALRKQVSGRRLICLFRNDHSPKSTDRLSDYTEPTDTRYSPAYIQDGNWEIEGDKATCLATVYSFTPVHGYFVTDATRSMLLGAERFEDGPLDATSGIEIALSMRVKVKNDS